LSHFPYSEISQKIYLSGILKGRDHLLNVIPLPLDRNDPVSAMGTPHALHYVDPL
jgi:hypothetical protein